MLVCLLGVLLGLVVMTVCIDLSFVYMSITRLVGLFVCLLWCFGFVCGLTWIWRVGWLGGVWFVVCCWLFLVICFAVWLVCCFYFLLIGFYYY